MSETPPRRGFAPNFQRNIVAGVLALMPLLVTWFAFSWVVEQLERWSQPWLPALSESLAATSPGLARALFSPWVAIPLQLVVTVLALYLLGFATTRVLGQRLFAVLDGLFARIPLAKSVYGATRRLLATFQSKPEGVQRVVLIGFPSPGLKTIGFVTKTLTDSGTGRQLAVVFVPTAPNPTSGYLEIVPLEDLTSTDWTMDEAMSFILTGGVTAPDTVDYGAKLPV